LRLYISPISPYARIVAAVGILKGLDGRIEKVRARDVGVDLGALNPLGKVPTLVTDSGEVLIESALICRYLDEIGDGPRLYGADPAECHRTLQLEALGQGVLDAAVACRMEVREHPPEKQSASWLERQHRKVEMGLAAVEGTLDEIGATVGIPHITYACMLFFVDHHNVFETWRETHPDLATWYSEIRQHPVLTTTEPEIS